MDLNKAYDRIRWDYLLEVQKIMEFPQNWIQWIEQCITTMSYAILINGEPMTFFKPIANLRQGDPLSPYLFLLCIEMLFRKLACMQRLGELRGIKLNRKDLELMHLILADNALFFLKLDVDNVSAMRRTLENSCTISGELINYGKSFVMFSSNTPVRLKRFMRKSIGMGAKEKMGKYVPGVPNECRWEQGQ